MKTYLSFKAKTLRYRLKQFLLSVAAPGAESVIIETEFGPMACDPLDSHVSRQLMKWGHYNPKEVANYKEVSNGMDSALIIGSHIGSLAIQLADSFQSILCLEANPSTYRRLEFNVSLNRLGDILNTRCAAVCERNQPVSFFCSVDNSGGSKIQPVFQDINFVYDNPDLISVPGISLDSEYYDQTFDFILMDIEGSEFNAILGGKELLRRCSVFVVEFVPNHLERVANRSIPELSQLLLELEFDEVYFPRFGLGGDPKQCLLTTLQAIADSKSFEDGIVFKRHTAMKSSVTV